MKKNILLKNYSMQERRNVIFALLLLAFPVLQFLIFYLYINISSIFLAFQDIQGDFTFQNFYEVFRNFSMNGPEDLPNAVLRSVITWTVSTAITFPISILFTYALFKKIPGEMIFRIIFFLPGLIGAVIMTTLYRKIVATGGPIIELFKMLGFEMSRELLRDGLLSTNNTAFQTILFYSFWTGLGGSIIVFTGALTRIPTEIFESAKIDGASFMTEFFKITLPLIFPTISTVLIFSMGGIFVADGGTFLLIGRNAFSTTTAGYYIFMQQLNISELGSTNYGYPAAIGLVFTVITIPGVLIIRHYLEKYTDVITY